MCIFILFSKLIRNHVLIFQVAEEGKKIGLLNVELADLKHKLSQNVELEKKIEELQNKLENAKSPKEASLPSL